LWELYDLATDPSESKNLAAAKPDMLAKLTALATKAHEPVREGAFSRSDRHERDRRAKFGKQDEPDTSGPKAKGKGKANGKAAANSTPLALPVSGLLPSKDWKIVRVSSENTANQKVARNAGRR
jgi:hypothetical protein